MLIFDSKKYSFNTYLSDNMYRDQDGYLVCENAVLGRTGIQRYGAKELGLKDKEGIIEVHRKPEDVFDEESLHSLEGRAFTLGHNSGTNIKNFFKKAKGIVFNVRREENNIVGDIRIFDEKVAEMVEKGELRELSLGYKSTLFYDEDKDEYSFKEIIYNHLALVLKGRAGNAMIFDEEREEETMEKDLDTKDEVVEEVKDEVTEETIKTEEVKDEDNVSEDKEETKEEKKDENEDPKEVKDEEPKEKEKEKMVKDTAYFLEMQERIAKVDDKEVRAKLSESLRKEMKESGLFEETPKEPDIVVKDEEPDNEEQNIYDSHEDNMNHYYSQFDPHLYETEAEYEKARRELCNSKPTEKIVLDNRVKK